MKNAKGKEVFVDPLNPKWSLRWLRSHFKSVSVKSNCDGTFRIVADYTDDVPTSMNEDSPMARIPGLLSRMALAKAIEDTIRMRLEKRHTDNPEAGRST